MSSGSARWTRPKLEPAAPGAQVTWLELFYDLIFAFAFIRVTLTAEISLASLVRAVLLVSLLWFLWINFSTLGNFIRGDEGVMPLATLTGAGATFVAALLLPYAYGPRLRLADYLFVGCYLVVRSVQLLVYWERIHRDPRFRPRWSRVIGLAMIGYALLLIAALLPLFVTRHIFGLRMVVLALAVTLAYTWSVISNFRQLKRVASRHWTDRYAQILLIALGESIIAIGTARRPSEILAPTWPVLASGALGLVIITTLAFNYFDHHMVAGEHALRETPGPRQIVMARDAYVFLHLPMIIGILLFSLGLNEVHTQIQDPAAPAGGHPGVQSVALLYGGVFLYGAAVLGFQARTRQHIGWFEFASRPPLLLAIPAVALLPSMYALLLLAAFVVAVAALKHARTVPHRRRIRAAAKEQRHRVMVAIEEHERALQAAETSEPPAEPTWPNRGNRRRGE